MMVRNQRLRSSYGNNYHQSLRTLNLTQIQFSGDPKEKHTHGQQKENYSCLLWGLSASPWMGTEVIWDPPCAELPLLRLENFSLNLIQNPSPSHDRGMEADRQQVRGCLPTMPLLSWSKQESGQQPPVTSRRDEEHASRLRVGSWPNPGKMSTPAMERRSKKGTIFCLQ